MRVRLPRFLLSGVLVVCAALSLAQPVSSETKSKVLEKMSQLLTESAFVPGADFSRWTSLVAEDQKVLDATATETEFSEAVNSLLRKLGYSHVVLIRPTIATARRERQAVGIGVQLQREEIGLRVVTVYPASPAEEAGLEVGDLIVEGNGKKAVEPSELAGSEGEVLELKVLKASGTESVYKITRRKFSNTRPESLQWLDDETAVLKVPTFDVGYDRKRVETLFGEAAKAKQLVLDLRANPGGAVINLTHLMSHLVPKGTPLGTFISKRTVDEFVKETGGSATDLQAIADWSKFKLRAAVATALPFNGKVAVLVNGASGSASEIAAAALQEQLDAPVVGTRSAGAVLVSIMSPLTDGYMLQFPITDFVTSKGVRLEGRGVYPTVEAPPTARYGEKDVALEKAVALLKGGW